jgi:hypothetical protein
MHLSENFAKHFEIHIHKKNQVSYVNRQNYFANFSTLFGHLLKAVNQLFSQRKSSLSFFLIAYIR